MRGRGGRLALGGQEGVRGRGGARHWGGRREGEGPWHWGGQEGTGRGRAQARAALAGRETPGTLAPTRRAGKRCGGR